MNKLEPRTIAIVDVKSRRNLAVMQPVNLYGCKIDDESFVGLFVKIQKGDGLVSHGAMFINEPFVTDGPIGKWEPMWPGRVASFTANIHRGEGEGQVEESLFG
jgi:hypothetical protein